MYAATYIKGFKMFIFVSTQQTKSYVPSMCGVGINEDDFPRCSAG